MIIYKIEIGNFYSIRNTQALDLRVSNRVSSDSARVASCWSESEDRVPKVIVLLGANGSGKSNVLRALSFITWFVDASHGHAPVDQLPFEPFYDQHAIEDPTSLKVWFSAPDFFESQLVDQPKMRPYSYELEISNGGGGQRVLREAMFYWPAESGRKTCAIQRTEDGLIKSAKSFSLAGYRSALEKVLKPNASVISTLAELKHPIAASIVNSMRMVRCNIFIQKLDVDELSLSRYYQSQPSLLSQFNSDIRRLGCGIRAVEINDSDDTNWGCFVHDNLCKPVSPMQESFGMRQLFKLYPLINEVLNHGGVAVIDDLDVAMHPMVVSEIVNWFLDTSRNRHDAQLWMSGYAVSILKDLTKDEIIFCEKNRHGATEICPLSQVQGVRRNDNFHKKYLDGEYGGLPLFN